MKVYHLIIVVGVAALVMGLSSCSNDDEVPVVTLTGSLLDAEITMGTAKQYCRKFGSTVKTLQAFRYNGVGGRKSKVTLVCHNNANFEGAYDNFVKLAGTKETLDNEHGLE